MYNEILLMHSSERFYFFHGVEMRLRTMIVFTVGGRCDKRVSRKHKKGNNGIKDKQVV